MSGKTKLVVVLILGTITGGYFLWRSSLWSVPDIPAYVQTAATAQGRGKQTTTEVGNLAIKENKKLTLAQDNRTDLLRIAQQDSYGKAYSQLVGVKSAEAKYLTYKIVISCAAYIGKWADATRLQIEEGSRGAALEKKLEAFNRMKRRCDGVPTEPLSHPIGSPLDITTSRDEATAMHDPRAMADGLAIRPTAFYEPHAAALAENTRLPAIHWLSHQSQNISRCAEMSCFGLHRLTKVLILCSLQP